jgi:hypothetical protein
MKSLAWYSWLMVRLVGEAFPFIFHNKKLRGWFLLMLPWLLRGKKLVLKIRP